MNRLTAIALALTLTACAGTMPNNIEHGTSNFDGSTYIKLQPAFVYRNHDTWSGADFKLGLYWNNAAPDMVIIQAVALDEITSLQADGGLQFNIDGDIISLSSPTTHTNLQADVAMHTLYKNSSRPYVGTTELLERIITASKIHARLLTSNGALEGDINIDRMYSIKTGIAEFRQQINQVKNR